jgi:hypothetical protein
LESSVQGESQQRTRPTSFLELSGELEAVIPRWQESGESLPENVQRLLTDVGFGTVDSTGPTFDPDPSVVLVEAETNSNSIFVVSGSGTAKSPGDGDGSSATTSVVSWSDGGDKIRPVPSDYCKCGPDITRSLAELLKQLAGLKGSDDDATTKPGEISFIGASMSLGSTDDWRAPLDLKQYVQNPSPENKDEPKSPDDKLKCKDDSVSFVEPSGEKDCPHNCPTKAQAFGCVTLCNKCVEASVIGNLLAGYVEELWFGLQGAAGLRTISAISAHYHHDLSEDRDQCAMDLGHCVLKHKSTGDLKYYWDVKSNKDPTVADICQCIGTIMRGCKLQVDSCNCPICHCEADLPKFKVKRGKTKDKDGKEHDDNIIGLA